MDKFGREKNLIGFEIPKKIYLAKEPFSIENQLMTPTMKLRRQIAKKYFEKEILKLKLSEENKNEKIKELEINLKFEKNYSKKNM